MKTKFKVLIAFLVAVLSILIYSGVMLLSDSRPKAGSNVIDDTAYNIIHAKSSELTLGNDEMNSLVKLLPKKKAINSIEVSLEKGNIKFNIYCSYKKINFLLSTKGSLKFSDNQLIFIPESFKIGRLTVPKSIAFYFMKKYSTDTVKFLNNDSIALSADILHIKISSLNISDGKMHISIAKAIVNNNAKTTVPQGNSQQNQPQNNNNTSTSKPYVYNNDTNNNSSNSNNTNIETPNNVSQSQSNTQNNQKDSTTQLLQSVSCQLSDAIARASNTNERNVLCKIQSSVNNKISNPNYDFNKDIKDVNHAYASLSTSERKNLQSIILGTVDIASLNKLKSVFGTSIP